MIELSEKDFIQVKNDFTVLSVSIDPEFAKEHNIDISKIKTGKQCLIDFTATIKFDKNEVDVSYSDKNVTNKETFFKELNNTLNWIELNNNKINNSICDKLLPLKNEKWCFVDENKHTNESFIKKIGKLKSILFITGDNCKIYINDNGLFKSHDIEVEILKETIKDINIVG